MYSREALNVMAEQRDCIRKDVKSHLMRRLLVRRYRC